MERGARHLREKFPSLTPEKKLVSRRNVMRLMGLGGLAGYMFDSWFTDVKLERKRLDIKTLDDPEAKRDFPDTSWLFLPGFNVSWDDSERYMRALQPSLRQRGQSARIGYSNEGLNVNDVYRTIVSYANDNHLKKLNLYGHSFGGMVAIEMAARLQNDGFEVPLIALDSSPASSSDVLDKTQFDWLTNSAKLGIKIPTSLRFGASAVANLQQKNTTFNQAVDEAIQAIDPRKCSSTLLQSEADYMSDFTASYYNGKLKDTTVVYLGNPEDRTVNYQMAFEGWRQALPANFIPAVFKTYGAGHADPDGAKQIYQEQMESIQNQFLHLPTAADNQTHFPKFT